MKKIIKYLFISIICLFPFVSVNAKETTTINLNTLKGITEYKSYDDFLESYKSNSLPDVYITNFLFDGVSKVLTPDLDDFVEASSNDTKVKELEIKVININNTGNYELTGTIKGAMIAVNTNNLKGNINIILNGVTLDTDSKKAPAIYVYNKDKNYTDCIVTIKTVKGTTNTLEGGKLKKVSLLGSDELSKYTSNYSGDALTNYNTYSNYYGIYTSEQIKDILFATVTADNEDLKDGDPLYFYKASGAISSDIDLYFEGEGLLKVTSKNKEGIETKGNLTFSGGTGDYEIYAQDDCLNTTTASSKNTTVRNDITIDVNSLLAIVDEEGDEGDAIDSNGKLTINGGTIYAFAHTNSGDAGVDSANGIYINGGTVIATGNMADPISNESKQKYIYASLNSQVKADDLIVIKDQDDNVITAFKTSRSFKNILYSSKDLDYTSYKVYTGGTISGEETNGLYTKIDNYTGGTEISTSNASNGMKGGKGERRTTTTTNNNSNSLLTILLIEISVFILFIGGVVFLKRKKV